MLEALAFLAVGLLLLIRGADVFIDNAIGLARGWGVSTHVIGVTLVAFATSLPEVLVSLLAGTRGYDALA
ncbi:MAG: calcium/sodium antiporter, partial [Candidatus Poseidoniia archaeon]